MKKKNNKGFTLVELIIVVAIIAVLAAVLAPQYLQYVERSRQSNDLQIATSIMRAATAAVADPQNNVPTTGVITVVWATNTTSGNPAAKNALGASNSNVLESIEEVMGDDPIAAESSAGNSTNFVFTIDPATGAVTDTSAAVDGVDPWADEIGVNP